MTKHSTPNLKVRGFPNTSTTVGFNVLARAVCLHPVERRVGHLLPVSPFSAPQRRQSSQCVTVSMQYREIHLFRLTQSPWLPGDGNSLFVGRIRKRPALPRQLVIGSDDNNRQACSSLLFSNAKNRHDSAGRSAHYNPVYDTPCASLFQQVTCFRRRSARTVNRRATQQH